MISTMRLTWVGLACVLAAVAGPVFASSDSTSGRENSAYGSAAMMGATGGGMMGWGWAGGRGTAANSSQLSDDCLDRLGDGIAERYQLMGRIASEQDKSARRNLVRQYLETRAKLGGSGCWTPGRSGYGAAPYGTANPRARGYGMFRYGPGGYGMMGYGPGFHGMMGPGMMRYGPMGYGPMAYGPMGYGMMGYGSMGYGIMGSGPMGYRWMRYGGMFPGAANPEGLSNAQLDRISKQMAANYAFRQKLAQTTDESQRRKLLRDHLEELRKFLDNLDQEQ